MGLSQLSVHFDKRLDRTWDIFEQTKKRLTYTIKRWHLTQRIFKFHEGDSKLIILILAYFKNCQNGTFEPLHGLQILVFVGEHKNHIF